MADVPVRKLAVIVPGVGYHGDKPLLYYAKKIARNCGYELRELAYRGLPSVRPDDAAGMEAVLSQAEEQFDGLLCSEDVARYDTVLFVAKSIGTALVPRCVRSHALRQVRAVLYTPIAQTFALPPPPAIVFHGTADPWLATQDVRAGCGRYGLSLHEFSGANHSLETGDALRDIGNLLAVMQETERYIRHGAY